MEVKEGGDDEYYLGDVVEYKNGVWRVELEDTGVDDEWLEKDDLLLNIGVYKEDEDHWEGRVEEEEEDKSANKVAGVTVEKETKEGTDMGGTGMKTISENSSKKRRTDDEPHICNPLNFHKEDDVRFKKTKAKQIGEAVCSGCNKSMMDYTFTNPMCVCPKTWHGWELDGFRGLSGRAGPCTAPFYCFSCHVAASTASGDGGRRKRSRRETQIAMI
jgi:hypothetical protein